MITYKSKLREYAIKKVTTNSGGSTYCVYCRVHEDYGCGWRRVLDSTRNLREECVRLIDNYITVDDNHWDAEIAKEEWV